MFKKIIGVSIALAMVLPLAASAATVTNVTFSNGDVTIAAPVNSTVSGTLHVIVPPNQAVQWLGVNIDGLAEKCTAVSLGEGTHDVSFSALNAPNTGTYNFTYRLAGKWGGIPSVDCSDNVVAGNTVGSSVKATGVSTGGNFAGTGMSLADLIAALKAAGVGVGSTTPAPAPVTSACSEYNSLRAGLSVGSDTRPGGSVGKFQSFLMYKGFNIPLLSANQAPYGYFGNQTNSASMSFAAANGCN